MTRRCLICSNLNPCPDHSDADQDRELARNDAAIAQIRAGDRLSAGLPTIGDWACQIADRVFAEHGFDVTANPIARAMRKSLAAELPAARVRPSTPVLLFMKDMSRARRFDEWHEDHGDVLWFRLPIVEPPYVGSPLDCGTTVETHGPRGLIMRGTVGGWPFDEDDEPSLCWAPIPCPELILKGEEHDDD